MPTLIAKKIFTLVSASVLLGMSPIVGTAPALAYDDDVDIVCDTYSDGEVFCVTVDKLKAECPELDPDNELEICAGLYENRKLPKDIKGFKASAGKKTMSLKSVLKAKRK